MLLSSVQDLHSTPFSSMYWAQGKRYILGYRGAESLVLWPTYTAIISIPCSLSFFQDKEGVEGVSVGAILSDYQRVRVENV